MYCEGKCKYRPPATERECQGIANIQLNGRSPTISIINFLRKQKGYLDKTDRLKKARNHLAWGFFFPGKHGDVNKI